MGSSSLNINGISKRVVYSESVSKMLQDGIEKSNFSDGRFDHLCKPTNQPVDFLTLMGSSSLNIDGISKRVVYSESVSKMPQHGIEKSNFSDGQFNHLCILIKL